MAKFTDAVRTTLQGHFDAGDQPTEAQFDALILAIQQGIEEHDHDGTGDGDGITTLAGVLTLDLANGRVGVGTLTPADVLDVIMAGNGTGIQISAPDTAGGLSQPALVFDRGSGATVAKIVSLGGAAEATQASLAFYTDAGAGPILALMLNEDGRCIMTNLADAYLDIISDSNADSADCDASINFFIDGGPGVGTQKGAVIYDQSLDIFRLSYGNAVNHFAITNTGSIRMGSLAGVGVRAVVADAAGNLSAP